MRRLLRENGLSIVLVSAFMLFWVGQSIVGHREYNQEQVSHGEPAIGYRPYLTTAHFWEATTENWESEFLQIFSYVMLTAMLVQKGSAESRKPDEPASEPKKREPGRRGPKPDAPWPVRRGGLALGCIAIRFRSLFYSSFSPRSLSTPCRAPRSTAKIKRRTASRR